MFVKGSAIQPPGHGLVATVAYTGVGGGWVRRRQKKVPKSDLQFLVSFFP